jgi:hypothetical protein
VNNQTDAARSSTKSLVDRHGQVQHMFCSQVSSGAAISSRRGAAQSRVVDTSRRSTAAVVDRNVKFAGLYD